MWDIEVIRGAVSLELRQANNKEKTDSSERTSKSFGVSLRLMT